MWGDDIKMDLQKVEWGSLVWADDSRGQVAGSCEGRNEPLDPIKCGEFLDKLKNSKIFKTDSAPCSK